MTKISEGCGARLFLILFGAAFLSAGLILLYFMAINPLSKVSKAKSWNETPCKVIWSRVRTHENDEGSDTYDVEIFYEYNIDGELHRSNSYTFVGGSSSGMSGKSKIVRKHPPGKEMVCYVNPDLPEQAILVRDISSIGFWWLLSIPFTLIGGGILLRSIYVIAGFGKS